MPCCYRYLNATVYLLCIASLDDLAELRQLLQRRSRLLQECILDHMLKYWTAIVLSGPQTLCAGLICNQTLILEGESRPSRVSKCAEHDGRAVGTGAMDSVRVRAYWRTEWTTVLPRKISGINVIKSRLLRSTG